MKQSLLTILFTFVLVNASKAQQVTHIVDTMDTYKGKSIPYYLII